MHQTRRILLSTLPPRTIARSSKIIKSFMVLATRLLWQKPPQHRVSSSHLPKSPHQLRLHACIATPSSSTHWNSSASSPKTPPLPSLDPLSTVNQTALKSTTTSAYRPLSSHPLVELLLHKSSWRAKIDLLLFAKGRRGSGLQLSERKKTAVSRRRRDQRATETVYRLVVSDLGNEPRSMKEDAHMSGNLP